MNRTFFLSLFLVVGVALAALAWTLSGRNGAVAQAAPSGAEDREKPPVAELQGFNSGTAAIAPDPAERTELNSPPAAQGFEASGTLRLLGHSHWPADLQLDWMLSDGTTTSFIGKPQWEHRFQQVGARLVAAGIDGLPLALAGEWNVSASAPRAEIEVFDPSEIVLDVRSRAEPQRRVEGLTLVLNPISERRSLFEEPKEPSSGAGEATQIQKTRENPLVVRQPSTPRSITLLADGFEPLEFSDGLAPGLHRVELIPARRLLLDLRAVSGASAPIEVGFRASGDKSTFDWRPVRLPGRLELALGQAEQAELVVRLEPELGLGPELLRETVVLDPLQDTRCSFELDLAVAETAGGSLRVELVEAGHSDLGNALLKLQRCDELLEEVLKRRTSPSPLSRWPDDGVSGVVSREFRGLAAGQYQLTVEPLGLEQKVEIRAGETTFVRLAAAELGTLQIAPVGSAGRLGMDQVPGSLWWRLDDEPENTAPGIDGQQIASGRARSAEILDTHWQVRAPVGARIIVQFLGPKVLGATPLRLTVQPGTTEATLSFAGL